MIVMARIPEHRFRLPLLLEARNDKVKEELILSIALCIK